MGIRDSEIQRLVHYAKSLGVNVIFLRKYDKYASANWALDGTEITIYNSKNKNKTEIIMDLLHELGHSLWWIHEKNRQPDLKFEEAIYRQNLVEKDDLKNPAPKHLRKKIVNIEKAGTLWWFSICKEVDIKIPEWKVNLFMEFDIWAYEIYYETGFFPTIEKKKEKFKELRAKWKPGIGG